MVFLILLSAPVIDALGAFPAPLGTFSNLEYHQASGDLAGFEIKIVPTGRGLQGALVISEGMPSEF